MYSTHIFSQTRSSEIFVPLRNCNTSRVQQATQRIIANGSALEKIRVQICEELTMENCNVIIEFMKTVKNHFKGDLTLVFSYSLRKQIPCDELMVLLKGSG